MWSSSSDDLCEMMKTLASNTVTLQQNVMSFQQEIRSSIQLGEANGASSFKCGEIGSTNEWKIALLSIESNREC